MAIPATSTKTISDLVPDVIDALQQRTDVASLVPRYVKRALQEITESYPLEELRRSGPTVELTALNPIYPVAFFVNSNEDYTSLETLTIFVDPPNNTVGYPLNYKTPKAIVSMLSPATQGIPAYWTRFGVNLQLAPVPMLAYTMVAQYQVKHPFPEDDKALLYAPIYIPSSWEEIVVYSAAMRIAIVKRWNDQKNELHQTLYGDPEYQLSQGKRGRPGLIAARLFQVERDQAFNSRSLGISVPRYGAR